MRRSGFVAFVLASLTLGAVAAGPAAAGQPQKVIVVMRSGSATAANPVRAGASHATAHERIKALLASKPQTRLVKPAREYGSALLGFSATLTPAQQAALAADPAVDAIVPDEVTQLTDDNVLDDAGADPAAALNLDTAESPSPAPSTSPSPSASPRPHLPTPGPDFQIVPTGVERVGRVELTGARINGRGANVDADIAIVDTGVSAHPDLNVAGGVDCTKSRIGWRDANGHGTHVSGTAAGLDNDVGVVGVAPGARIWSVKVLNANGYGRVSWLLCGIDWVAAQRDGDRPLIEVANMSLSFRGVTWKADDGHCGNRNHDAVHKAICAAAALGTIFVAAAGNNDRNAKHYRPAAYNEVITVSALSDFDGKPGALGVHSDSCPKHYSSDRDDVLAKFSNYGADIDIMAPGKCIWSTYLDGRYKAMSGTSMATPHVSGAVALYLVLHPDWTFSQVRAALIACGTHDWRLGSDKDRFHEYLLDVATLCS